MDNHNIQATWGGYSFTIFPSDLAKHDYDYTKWRYRIVDPEGTVHPGRLSGESPEYAAHHAIEDIKAHVKRADEAAKLREAEAAAKAKADREAMEAVAARLLSGETTQAVAVAEPADFNPLEDE
jgi:hypothetical protein